MLLHAAQLAEGMNHTVHMRRKASWGKSYRQQREDESAGVPKSGIDIEIVISRFSETNMTWLKDVPEFYRVTVYNKARIPGLLYANNRI